MWSDNCFFFSTSIQIGDGNNTPFWEGRWINGMSPKEMAPSLYCMTRLKRRTFAQESRNNNWIRNLQDVNCTAHLEEFTLLFMALADIHLSDKKMRLNGTGHEMRISLSPLLINVSFMELCPISRLKTSDKHTLSLKPSSLRGL
jgi:hypothetical protein